MTDSATLIRRWEQLAAERVSFESTWQDIADHLLGRRDVLGARAMVSGAGGARRDALLYDGTSMQAADTLAASLHGLVTNPSMRWFALRLEDASLGEDDFARRWLAAAEDLLYDAFAAPSAGHAQACHEFYLDLGAFGTAGMFLGDAPGKGLVFSARALGELAIAEDAAGRVDTVFRRFALTARQARQEWGAEAGEKVARALAAGRAEERFEFLHAVFPRTERDGARRDGAHMAFASCYVSLADRAVVAEGGFHEMPYLVARWSKDAGETYGRGPGWNALADQKMLHAMSKTVIKAAQKAVDPPLLVADDGVVLPVRTVPGGLNFGRMDGRGPFIQPLSVPARLDIGFEMMEQRRQAVRAAFHADVLQVMRDPRMTAAQVYEIAGEMMRVMGPVLGRLQAEFLGPMIARGFALLARQGALPPAPPQLTGARLKVEYVSPLARAQKAGQAQAVLRTYEPALRLAQAAPEVLDNLDHDEALRVLAEANGAPPKILKDRNQVAEARRSRAVEARQAAMKSDLMMMAEGAGKALPALATLGGRAAS
ncbi:MAG: portal protein [Alphaproteobacteria bacterium]